MKQFYSCLDITIPAPQAEQHSLANIKANIENGLVVFYSAEDILTYRQQLFILPKLARIQKNIDGVIFFTVDQFCYSGKLNGNLLRNIIDMGLEIHFSREDISIRNYGDLLNILNELICYINSQSPSIVATKFKVSSL